MRWLAFSIALAAALSAAYLEYLVLTYIMNPCTKSGDSLLALSIAPVASITLIVIFMLLGAFQGFKDKDLKTIPGETLLSKSTGE